VAVHKQNPAVFKSYKIAFTVPGIIA